MEAIRPFLPYITVVALLLTGVIIVWARILEFHHYDYRKKEREERKTEMPGRTDEYYNDGLPTIENDDWIDEWYYDPETKSFKQK